MPYFAACLYLHSYISVQLSFLSHQSFWITYLGRLAGEGETAAAERHMFPPRPRRHKAPSPHPHQFCVDDGCQSAICLSAKICLILCVVVVKFFPMLFIPFVNEDFLFNFWNFFRYLLESREGSKGAIDSVSFRWKIFKAEIPRIFLSVERPEVAQESVS